mmetsp:Transcript_29945/g.42728  ORF Transcript_29945/g.42728 Transcript_29945/m.42728 type:complete len:159 (+) Transcript_29945:902-1378(+)
MSFEFHAVVSAYIRDMPDQLIVQSTSIPGCKFLGLFAKVHFSKGDIVCIYNGTRLSTKEALHLSDKSYLMRIGEQRYIDAKTNTNVLARYINDCIDPLGWNVEFIKSPEDWIAYVVAIKDITPGDEIFVSYGKWYWLSGPKPVKVSVDHVNSRSDSLH